MSLAVDFHPEAVAEFIAGAEWWDDQEVGLGRRFVDAVRAAVDDVAESPNTWAIWPGWDREPVVRSRSVPGFPVRVIYVVREDRLTVVAVAHSKRRPGFWRNRLR